MHMYTKRKIIYFVRGCAWPPLCFPFSLSHLLSKCTAATDTVGSLLPCNSQRQIYARIVCFVAEAKFLTHSSAQATMTARE